MTRPEIDRLLALYSSGQISDDERDALFTAALQDQALFQELFEEDGLRTALEDPAIRRAALALPARQAPARQPFWRTPWPAAVAALAACAVLAVILVRRPEPAPPPRIAAASRPPAAPAPAERKTAQPAPPPAPVVIAKRKAAPAAGAVAKDAAVVATQAESVAVQTMAFREDSSPVTAVLQLRDADGQWRPAAPGATIARGTPLRVTVESKIAGRIAFTPAFTPAAPIQPDKPLIFHLPVQAPGDRVLQISLLPAETPAAAAAVIRFRID